MRRLVVPALIVAAAGCAVGPRPVPTSPATPAESAALESLLRGGFAAAHDGYRTLAEQPAATARLHAAASVAARLAGRLPQARAHRESAARLEPLDGWHRLRAAQLRLESGDAAGTTALLDTPATAWEWLTRGMAERRLGDLAGSASAFAAARAADPGFSLAAQEHADVLAQLGRDTESASAYGAALAIDPSLTYLQIRLAAVEQRLGRRDAAYERYRKMLLVDPGHPVAKAEKARLSATAPELAAAETAKETAKETEWLGAAAPSASPFAPAGSRILAVGVVPDVPGFRIRCASAVAVSTTTGTTATVPAQTGVSGSISGGLLRLTWSGGGFSAAAPVRLTPAASDATFSVFNIHFERGSYWSEQETRAYRGSFLILPRGEKLTIVNDVPVEEYLLSVVPSEMPFAWPAEALAAQAVAARTETYAKWGRHAKDGFGVCATQHCAVYRGLTGEKTPTTAAVQTTRGWILRAPDGRPSDAVYAANCGGFGSAAGAIWGTGDAAGGACDVPHDEDPRWSGLPADPDLRDRFVFERPPSYCAHRAYAASYRWTRGYDASELERQLQRRFPSLGALVDVRPGARTPEGWVISITVSGTGESREVKRDAIRPALMTIRSNAFVLLHLPAGGAAPEQYVLVGAGWGHGAGMCQDGAYGMAKRGFDWKAILRHYYRGATLERETP